MNPIAAPVAYVYETIVGNCHTVGHLHERIARTGLRFCLRTLQNPLTEELPVAIKYGHAVIAAGFFAIRHINVAVARIDRHRAGSKESRMARI